jgi:hypothetical protein
MALTSALGKRVAGGVRRKLGFYAAWLSQRAVSLALVEPRPTAMLEPNAHIAGITTPATSLIAGCATLAAAHQPHLVAGAATAKTYVTYKHHF